jgi:hypothetical protein
MKPIILILVLIAPLVMVSCSDRTQVPDHKASKSTPAAREPGRAAASKTAGSALSEPTATTPAPRATPRPSVSDRSQTQNVVPSSTAQARGVNLVRFVLAARIEAREPVGQKTTFAPGERVYAFLELDNEKGEPFSLLVRFERDAGPRTTGLRLEVPRMKRYRTNAFSGNTSKPGTYHCIVTTEDGTTLAKQTFKVAG